jgi:hypothetical protein
MVHDGAGQGVERYEVSQHPCSFPARYMCLQIYEGNLTSVSDPGLDPNSTRSVDPYPGPRGQK